MIAVLLVKDVDERVAADGRRLFEPEDVLQIARQLHDIDEWRRKQADPRTRNRPDLPTRTWEEVGAERRWACWHRAQAAVQRAEAQHAAGQPPRGPFAALADAATNGEELPS